MGLQQHHQPEVVKQAAKVKARTRPWHAYIALALAIIAAGVSYWFGSQVPKALFENGHLGDSVAATAAAAAFFVFAIFAVVAFARRARQALESVTGSRHHAALVRYVIVLVGAIVVIIITLVLLKVPVSQLLAAGVLAGIVVTITAQQSLDCRQSGGPDRDADLDGLRRPWRQTLPRPYLPWSGRAVRHELSRSLTVKPVPLTPFVLERGLGRAE